jgi:hypothetical protein
MRERGISGGLKMKVTLQNGTVYLPKVIFFHKVWFIDYVVFDGGLMMIRSSDIYKIENESKRDVEL